MSEPKNTSSGSRKRKAPDPDPIDGGLQRVESAPDQPIVTGTSYKTPSPTKTNKWYQIFQLSPPQKKNADGTSSGVSVGIDEVEQLLRADGWEKEANVASSNAAPTEKQKILYYLYAIGFMQDEEKHTRIEEMKKFFRNAPTTKRMMGHLKLDSDISNISKDLHLWRGIQGSVLRYGKQEGAYTIFQGRKMAVSVRKQASKNCYTHAVGGTVGYKVCFDRKDNDYSGHTVDVARFMRHNFDDKQLIRRIVNNRGGKSQAFLEKMAEGAGLTNVTTIHRIGLELVPSCLKNFGPALVARFLTDDLFRNKGGQFALGGYVDEHGTYKIHRFDLENGKDSHSMVPLGKVTEEESDIMKIIEEKNKKSQTGSDAHADQIAQCKESPKEKQVESFHDDSVEEFHDESIEGETHGLHSLCMVGYRREKDNTFFLIQNSWENLPLFEASAAYLEKHLSNKGAVVFLGASNTKKDGSLPFLDSVCLESVAGEEVSEDNESLEAVDDWDAQSYDLEGAARGDPEFKK